MQVNLDSTRMALVNDTIDGETSPEPSETQEKQFITQIEELKETVREQEALVQKQQEQINKSTEAIESQLEINEALKREHSDKSVKSQELVNELQQKLTKARNQINDLE